ncbi:hypothetical protein [Nitrosococcus watsonii]|uniref:Uncharacterized protein n=1 Tax=Nitrosococcus watsoni (strain C-113) TaxID=105559 RepID=D8K4Z7_NITWC|nr:hypothetical protein [Nitrosococcus watsonii]ADJ27974.1 conserved hypothetical protein [Nitrosococcus watsonii C-113]
MNAYILRAKPHGKNRENEFLNGRISIGWPCEASFEGKEREDISTILRSAYPDITAISISMVDLFVNMPVGSIILTPSLQDKSLIHLFRTSSPYQYNRSTDTDEEGNPHYVEVEHLKTEPRHNLPKAVLRSLSGARKTLSRISQHYDLLDDFINIGFEAGVEANSKSPSSRTEAINVLHELLSSNSESIRLQAAVAIIEYEIVKN